MGTEQEIKPRRQMAHLPAQPPAEPPVVYDSICQAMVRLGRPLAQRFDNPFFTIELRRLARRLPSVEYWAIGLSFVPVMFLLAPLLERLGLGSPGPPASLDHYPALGCLVFFHAVSCFVTGAALGQRIFATEESCGMLEEVLILPYSRLNWLAAKLAYPFYGVTFAWLLAVPLYAFGALMGFGPLDVMLRWSLWPFVAGLIPLLLNLCSPRHLLRLRCADYDHPPATPDALAEPKEGKPPLAVAWLEARTDNPLLVHDWRIYNRKTPLWRATVYAAAGVALLGGIIFGLRPDTDNFSWVWLAWIALSNLLGYPAKLMAERWKQEGQRNGLTLLMISPLNSHEILRGRLLAAVLYGWSSQALLLGALLAALVWLAFGPWWIVTPLTVALCPLALTWAVWIGCNPGLTSTSDHRPRRHVDNTADFLFILQLMSAAAWGALAYFGRFWSPLLVWGLALALAAFNAALCAAWFRWWVSCLDRARRGDIVFPDAAAEKA